ncbi:MAG: hypothetical protein WBH88_01465, partial [Candidatus Methanoculleus thermohydrogenotrophicum]
VRVVLLKNASMILIQDACFGVKMNSNRFGTVLRYWIVSTDECTLRLSRMIFNFHPVRILGVEHFQEIDKFFTPIAFGNPVMDKPGYQIQSCLQTDGPMTNIFIIAVNGGKLSGYRHEIRVFCVEHLNAALFIERENERVWFFTLLFLNFQDICFLVGVKNHSCLLVKRRIPFLHIYAALWHWHWQFLRLSLVKSEQLPGILLPRRVPEYIVARAVVSRSHGDTRIPRVFDIANPRSTSLLPER